LFTELEAKLVPDLERDLERYKDQVTAMISVEIVKRYYYKKGAVIESLKNDPVLEKAISVLGDKELYVSTLRGGETTMARR